ncbi:PP136 [Orf virus]|uniref:Deoxyuridine 5'-triphosphate nucleotidohydrolase n=1 Tax=Orf virus TaxID=10258 RepID=F1AWU2_ORFV|nr:PP136 [Orf virus]
MEFCCTETLQVVRLSQNATIPARGSPGAAGLDLCSAYDCVIPSHCSCVVFTDLLIKLPPGCYGRIAPRSGLAVKHFIDVGAGVIDKNYRGNVGVVLFTSETATLRLKRETGLPS